MGSNYLTKEGSSSDSKNSDGLKFGKKIYFEDVGIGVNEKTGNGSKRNGNNGQPPRCQVEGCNVDLTDAKSYYSRHKVCGMHSKSPLVVVSGLQQRFCQQCSRFHRLPEFDQGKRSCRRRLAGHNERRRKPPPGSLLSSRLGRLSSSIFDDSTTKSGILLDFSLYSRHAGRELWPGSKMSEAVAGNQSASLEKFYHNPRPGDPENPPSKMYQQGSVGSAGESSFTIPLGECVTGVSTDSTCALSLLSNHWGSRNRSSGTDIGNLVNLSGASMSQSTSTQTVTISHSPISNPSWNFRGINGNEANMGFNGGSSDHLGLAQFSHGLDSQLQGDLLMDHQAHCYGSAATASQVHWSL